MIRGARWLLVLLVLISGAPHLLGAPHLRGKCGLLFAEQTPNAKPELFQFQSNFWVNLHDVLYRHAQAPQCPQGELNGECAHYYDVAPADEHTWKAAMSWYAANLAKRTLLFDDEMIRINNILAQLAPDDNLDHRGLPEGLVDALRIAAPVYRKYYWPDQEYRNQRWLAALTPKLQHHGAAIAERLSEIYGEPWPAAPMRVDLVFYGGRTGAYSTLDPAHLVISTADSRNQNDAALETLFHEASHALILKLREGLSREFKVHNKPVPRDLWHVLLFYSTGEVVRRKLFGYTPYAERNRLYDTADGWAHMRDVLERDWQPYLDGKTDRDGAIAKIAADY